MLTDDPGGPIHFRAKRWIYFAQAGIVGPLAVCSLIFGAVCLTGHWRDVNGRVATDAGWPLIIIGTCFALVFAQAVAQISHRRAPILRLCREGIELREVGRTTVDRFPFIPRLVRVAWSVLSGQGYRARVVRLAWHQVGEAYVVGPPMARVLILPPRADPDAGRSAAGTASAAEYHALHEVEFIDPVDQIAAAINRVADTPTAWHRLPSWNQDPTTC